MRLRMLRGEAPAGKAPKAKPAFRTAQVSGRHPGAARCRGAIEPAEQSSF